MLVEFDTRNNLVPSFPGVIAPLEELWISWIMKEIGLKPDLLAMLARPRVRGRTGHEGHRPLVILAVIEEMLGPWLW